MEEVIEANLKDLCSGGVAGDMSAEIAVSLVRAHDHHERVPSHDGRELLFESQITRINALTLQRDGIAIGRERLRHARSAAVPQCIFKLGDKKLSAFRAVLAHHG